MASPHVTIQVLPYEAGAAPSHLPFTLLSLNGAPHAVYTETPTHGGQMHGTVAWQRQPSACSTGFAWRHCPRKNH
ncbi:Scr1 family TA system antitoxin-like transcriptional regulator [Streptomyces sp. NPDC053720]|uniref:Scr1 family TA system antitoxin-like transcriptional regulator n=1 Tax=Streptomyces sp. NPDC053720 TaxID=3154855 RepID=UPI00341FFB2E